MVTVVLRLKTKEIIFLQPAMKGSGSQTRVGNVELIKFGKFHTERFPFCLLLKICLAQPTGKLFTLDSNGTDTIGFSGKGSFICIQSTYITWIELDSY